MNDKDHTQTCEDSLIHNHRQIRHITWIGLMINLFLAGLKFIVGFIGASQAVIADAIHSLSDMTTDFAVLWGMKLWSAPPDEDHPYGHGRIETVITATIGIILALVAIEISYKAVITLRDPLLRQPSWIAITGPALSILFKEFLYRWTVTVGKRTKSSAVIANAWHHRSDALSSMPALLAVAISVINPEWAFVDHIGAIIVSIFILKVSWDIIIPSFAELIDRGATRKERARICQVVVNVSGVKGVHAIRTRKAGSNIHVDLHIEVDSTITVKEGHDIAEDVKKELLAKGPDILDVVVHVEPVE